MAKLSVIFIAAVVFLTLLEASRADDFDELQDQAKEGFNKAKDFFGNAIGQGIDAIKNARNELGKNSGEMVGASVYAMAIGSTLLLLVQ